MSPGRHPQLRRRRALDGGADQQLVAEHRRRLRPLLVALAGQLDARTARGPWRRARTAPRRARWRRPGATSRSGIAARASPPSGSSIHPPSATTFSPARTLHVASRGRSPSTSCGKQSRARIAHACKPRLEPLGQLDTPSTLRRQRRQLGVLERERHRVHPRRSRGRRRVRTTPATQRASAWWRRRPPRSPPPVAHPQPELDASLASLVATTPRTAPSAASQRSIST